MKTHAFLLLTAIGLASLGVGSSAQAPQAKGSPVPYKAPRNAFGQPDLEGTWTNNSLTPLQRPAAWANKTALTDADGSYVHTGGRQATKPYDTNFQGYGRFLSDAKGQYYFRTIKPVEYTLMGMHRCPHIHVAVSQNGRRIFTSQFLIKGHPANVGDAVTRNLDPRVLQTILVDFKALPGSKLGELSADVDIVLGKTFNELQPSSKDSLKGTAKGIGMSRRRG